MTMPSQVNQILPAFQRSNRSTMDSRLARLHTQIVLQTESCDIIEMHNNLPHRSVHSSSLWAVPPTSMETVSCGIHVEDGKGYHAAFFLQSH